MNLVTIIVIIIVIWLVYNLIQSYNNLQQELREIRMKCISGGGNIDPTSGAAATQKNPFTSMKNSVVNGLQSVLNVTSKSS